MYYNNTKIEKIIESQIFNWETLINFKFNYYEYQDKYYLTNRGETSFTEYYNFET